jgi:hypothetical protein
VSLQYAVIVTAVELFMIEGETVIQETVGQREVILV